METNGNRKIPSPPPPPAYLPFTTLASKAVDWTESNPQSLDFIVKEGHFGGCNPMLIQAEDQGFFVQSPTSPAHFISSIPLVSENPNKLSLETMAEPVQLLDTKGGLIVGRGPSKKLYLCNPLTCDWNSMTPPADDDLMVLLVQKEGGGYGVLCARDWEREILFDFFDGQKWKSAVLEVKKKLTLSTCLSIGQTAYYMTNVSELISLDMQTNCLNWHFLPSQWDLAEPTLVDWNGKPGVAQAWINDDVCKVKIPSVDGLMEVDFRCGGDLCGTKAQVLNIGQTTIEALVGIQIYSYHLLNKSLEIVFRGDSNSSYFPFVSSLASP